MGLAVATAAAAQTRPAPKNPVAAAVAAPAVNPAALDLLKRHDQELDQLRTEKRKAAETEQKLTTESDALVEERRKLNQNLIDAAARIRAGEERVTAAEGRLHELDGNETELRRSLDDRRAVIAEVLAALQRIGHRPPPAVFAGAADAMVAIRTAISLGAVLPDMRGEADKLLAALTSLSQLKKEKTAERDELNGRLAELALSQKSMAGLIEQRQKRQAEVDQAIGSERLRLATLSRQADNLKDLIGKLEQGLDPAARTARAAPHPADDQKAAADGRADLAALHDPARLAPAVAFISAKGTLSLPVNGVRIRDFGASDGAGGNDKGISVAARAGAQVVAPCDGWVVYAAPYRSYGQLLILNVGGGYHVLLAGMERITVDLGQFILTGEPVAVMGSGTQVASYAAAGSSPVIGSAQPVLYIEFRKDGTPVDSNPWWAATENEKVRG